MDPLTIGLLVGLGGPLLMLISGWLGARWSRQSAKEANETNRFAVFNTAQEQRLQAAETGLRDANAAIAVLQDSDGKKTRTINRLVLIINAQNRYIAKLLRIIASHLPEVETALVAPDPEDVEFITGASDVVLPDETLE